MKNLLFVTVDSLRADHLGCYGYDRPTSPCIDELAGDVHRFENTFANAQATRASFPAIMTSTYPLMYGGFERLSGKRTVLAEPLSAAGYRTGGFHSNPFLSSQFGYGKGFDEFYDSRSEATMASWLRESIKQNLNDEGFLLRTLQKLFNRTERHTGIEIGSSYVKADDLTERAIEFVQSGPEAGNFLWVHYMDVHHPYVPPDRHQVPFRETPVADRESVRLRQKMLEDPEDVTDTELQTIIDIYDAEIRFVDTELRRLLDAVEEAWDDRLLFFTADHGEEFCEHGSFSHSTLHEEGIHVPLLVDVIDGASGVHDELVALTDLAPSILDYLDVSIPDTYQGHSIRPILEGGKWPRDHVIGEAGYEDDGTPRVYYRTHDWKYISDGDGHRLYDLDADPGETTDVAGEHPEVVGDIQDLLIDHRAAVEATDQHLDDVEVSEDIEGRLKALGYRE